MGLFTKSNFLISLSILLFIVLFSPAFSLPVGKDVEVEAPSSSPLSNHELHLQLPKEKPIADKTQETQDTSNQRNARTLNVLWDAANSMSMIPNIRAMFNSGAKYEWVPLGSLIFNNMFGEGTRKV